MRTTFNDNNQRPISLYDPIYFRLQTINMGETLKWKNVRLTAFAMFGIVLMIITVRKKKKLNHLLIPFAVAD